MRTGRTLQEVAAQIKAEAPMKRDFVANTSLIGYRPEVGTRGALHLAIKGEEIVVEPTGHCIRQIGERCGIPGKYTERMLDGNRDLLGKNIRHWFDKEPSNRMLRTLINGQGIGRAFLSERFRPLDNYDLAEMVLPEAIKAGCEIKSCEITETRLYIQAVTPKLELDLNALRQSTGGDLRKVDPVQAGVVISNSEVGRGSILVEPLLFRLSCFNGAVFGAGMRRNHIGKATGVFAELEAAAEYFTNATREMDDKVLWAKVNDVVKGVLSKEGFTSLATKFAATKDVPIVGAVEVVERVAKEYGMKDEEKKSVLDHLVEGGELTQFGLVNAVTRTAEDVDTYDRAMAFERIGGEIIELPPTSALWSRN